MSNASDTNACEPSNEADEAMSRRTFVGSAAVVVGAFSSAQAASNGSNSPATQAEASACADGTANDPPIKNQELFEQSLVAPARRLDFSAANGITGAQVFANLCADQKLSALFMAPGNYSITHEIAQVGIPSYGGRSEGAMCGAADGYIRASGEIAACSGTEGPGLTHMMMWVATAHFANTPMLLLASNKSLAAEDSQKGIQFMFQQNQTEGLRKYGKRITVPERIFEYGTYAFRNLKTGIPDVVHLDFPEEVASARHTDPAKLVNYFDKDRYLSESRAAPDGADLKKAVAMIEKAQRPVLVAGHGVMIRKAWEPLLRAVEKNDIPMVGSGPVRGAVPDDHRLSAAFANEALLKADLVIFVGQYLMPSVGDWTFAPGVPTIRVHPVGEDLGRNWPVDLGIVSDEHHFLEALSDALPRRKRASWVDEVAAATAKRTAVLDTIYREGLDYSRQTGTLHPAVLSQELHNFLYQGKIDPKQTVTAYDGAIIGSYVGQWLRAFRPAQEIMSMYQFGAMGPAFSHALGAAAAVQRGVGLQAAHAGAPVFTVTGDGCASYSLFELDTAMKYKLPVVCLVYNNNAWGTFPAATPTPKAMHLHLFQENLRYDKLAEALGARGAYVHTPEQLRAALQVAYDLAVRDKVSTVINCQGSRDFSVRSKYPQAQIPGFPPEPGVAAMIH